MVTILLDFEANFKIKNEELNINVLWKFQEALTQFFRITIWKSNPHYKPDDISLKRLSSISKAEVVLSYWGDKEMAVRRLKSIAKEHGVTIKKLEVETLFS